jgi:hypothetical protein
MPTKVPATTMETTMRTIRPAAILAATLGLLACGTAMADTVPPVRGNDTGGIIAYSLVSETDVRAIAIDHCAQYGKVAKFTGAQKVYGGYVSFACRWVPYGASDRPLRVRY